MRASILCEGLDDGRQFVAQLNEDATDFVRKHLFNLGMRASIFHRGLEEITELHLILFEFFVLRFLRGSLRSRHQCVERGAPRAHRGRDGLGGASIV